MTDSPAFFYSNLPSTIFPKVEVDFLTVRRLVQDLYSEHHPDVEWDTNKQSSLASHFLLHVSFGKIPSKVSLLFPELSHVSILFSMMVLYSSPRLHKI